MHRLLVACVAAVVASGSALVIGSASTAPGSAPDPRAVARQILDSPAGHFMSGSARQALQIMATGDRNLSSGADSQSSAARSAASTRVAQGGEGPGSPAFSNVRVNNPAEDSHQTDQTTQSETSIAAVGKKVAVGFNDSQIGLLFLTAAANLNGYGYSTDGGASFTDGGVIPNHDGCNNLGDPWLASDRQSAMYYSSLALCLEPPGVSFLDIGVAKSTDGGKTWAKPVIVTTSLHSFFYLADKDALTVGRDPAVASKDVLYDAWDDQSLDPNTLMIANGLPVAHSNDGGATWTIVYADRVPLFNPCPNGGATFTQYIGAVPIVDPSNGNLYVAALKFFADCPTPGGGKGGAVTRSIVVFKSTDGGNSFTGMKVADVTPAAPPFDGFNLGEGKFMRNLELPTVAMAGGNLYIAWNDGGSTGASAGHSHIRLASSGNGGAAWTTKFITSGANDEMQPAASGDESGLHILYYRRNADNTLDVRVSNSEDGTSFDAKRVTTKSFPGVFTLPPFDPIIAFGYMGDYIANISAGGSQLFAWGDNRDIVHNFLWPNGRNDPDVFFAAQSGG